MENLENSLPGQSENITPPQAGLPAQAGTSFLGKLKPKWPIVLGALGTIALFAVIIYAIYSHGTRTQQPQPTPTATVTVTPLITLISSPITTTTTPTVSLTPVVTPTPDFTGGWKTYINKTYGYSIMYPAEYYSDANEAIDTSFSIWNYDMRTKRGDEPLKEGEFKLDVIWSGVKRSGETLLEYIKRMNPDFPGANVDRGPFLEFQTANIKGYISSSTNTIWVENNSNVFYINTYTTSPAEKTNQILSTFKFLE